jgi:hypothetical protein
LKSDSALCLDVARWLAGPDADSVEVLELPDEVERTEQAVELVVRSPDAEIALEHTLIESSPDQTQDGAHTVRLLEGLPQLAMQVLPAEGRYELGVYVGSARGFNTLGKQTLAREQLVTWIERVAPTLVDGSSRTAPHHMAFGKPPDTPFDVKLARWPYERMPEGQPNIARFTFSRFKPADLEGLRVVRVRKCLDDKLPKLLAHGPRRRTVLVLEDRDLALANSAVIHAAVRNAAIGIDKLPDTIVLVDTSAGVRVAYRIYDANAWTEQRSADRGLLPS